MDNLAEGKQEVMVNGKPRHVLGYLQDFLFHPKRAMTPVRALSGGERNRPVAGATVPQAEQSFNSR
ncbi:ABC transporter ATP-binding protein [Salmonella enterica subsp. enterica]|nr:ABC transporter ATP-binding protein [Salmonella enterica subsp. enterica]